MKIIVMGCSGWIAHYLASEFKKRAPAASMVGTYHTKKPAFDFPMMALSNSDHHRMLDLMTREEPTAIVNLTRGESEADLNLHKKIIEFSNSSGTYYVYASSFNACDAQLVEDHVETELPSATSEYGKFKASCERALLESAKKFATFRFASTHGWAPNRLSRTESFLKRIASGEKVVTPRGIKQNRTAVNDLAAMMAAIVVAGGEGIFHLGTFDSSDEVDFLQRLAAEFGYDRNVVVPGEHVPTNANMVPGKIYMMFCDEFRLTESDTIAQVARMPGLSRYRSLRGRRDSDSLNQPLTAAQERPSPRFRAE